MASDPTAPNAHRFGPLPDARRAVWVGFARWERTYFPNFVGLVVEELRADYCRMRLPWRPELEQPAGFVHGGAIATLIDTVVVPAVGGAYDEHRRLLTLTMDVQYLGAVAGVDAVAEGWGGAAGPLGGVLRGGGEGSLG
ncbi:MAG: PaaI family thioesterase [Acidimicrobiales bacterium]|nr:PaaI family thioesterase [Acidimicrobiales bacterium]